jgi:uncharacterized protein
MENPFVIKSYVSKELFCDREAELDSLVRNCTNGVDTTLVSQRRMGKSALIYRLFDEITARKIDLFTIYVDIYATRSLSDFIKFLAEAILSKFPERSTFGRKFMLFIKSLRPIITYDAISGEPQVQIFYQSEQQTEYTLKGLLDFLDSQDRKILLAIDEFQQIREYPQKNIEELLRTYIQQLSNIRFIYCGSKKHLMIDIFTNAKKPFYSSTQFVALDKIAYDKYSEFIKHLFTINHVEILDEAVDYILEWTNRHTYYTQALCNLIFSIGWSKITVKEVKDACLKILQMNEVVFLQYRELLTPGQWNFLIAIAKEQFVSQVMANNFLTKYSIGTPANSRRLVGSLVDKELLMENITKEGTCYTVYDLFLSRWLEREY